MITRISVFHYHFLPGGVTTVIRDAAIITLNHYPEITELTLVSGRMDNLAETCEKIKSQLPESHKHRIKFCHIPDFAYLDETELSFNNMKKSISQVEKNLKKMESGADHLWIIHNHHIGKNPFFSKAVIDTASEGNQKILFHIHDFPESARFSNWKNLKKILKKSPYPRNANIRYAVINSRDRAFLIQEGLTEEEVYLIKDPVKDADPESFQINAEAKTRVTNKLAETYGKEFPSYNPAGLQFIYPVRTIRRKNPLEAGLICELLSSFLNKKVNLILTLPGLSSREKKFSSMVEQSFRNGLISGLFGIGQNLEGKTGLGFIDLIKASDAVISSSVQEGFGYLYLNALQWNKPLFSRYIDVMSDIESFTNKENSLLYKKIRIPVNNSDKQKIKYLYKDKITSWERVLTKKKAAELHISADQIFQDDSVDFSYLPISLQMKVLKRLQTDSSFTLDLTERNREMLMTAEILLKTSDIKNDREGIIINFGENAQKQTQKEILDFFNSEQSDITKKTLPAIDSLWNSFATLPHLKLLYDFK